MENCHECKEAVEGKAVSADGWIYHPEHFRCHFCKLQIRNFYYWDKHCGKQVSVCYSCKCEQDNPKCSKCNKTVDETFIEACSKPYHLNCFLCDRCHQPFQGGEFYPYKERNYDLACYWVIRLVEEQT